MRAIMYHYVRERNNQLPHFRFLDIEKFKLQLDYFDQNYGFVSRKEWEDFSDSGTLGEDVSGKVLLTFDDAMSCHYDFVFPELVKRGLWGFFYVPTFPYLSGQMLDVHCIHMLCGAINGDDLLNAIEKKITINMIPDSKRSEFRKKTYNNQNNYSGVTEFKRIFNYFIDYKYRKELLDELALEFDFSFAISEFYVAKKKLIEMHSQGMVIGSHTNTHPVMSKLSYNDQRNEIETSCNYLKSLLNNNSRMSYCHPYGGFHSFDKKTIKLLNENAVSFAFNVESRLICQNDWHNSIYYLPRFDCNEFIHGEAS